MEITDIIAHKVKVKLTKPIKVTFGEIIDVETLIIRISTDTEIFGYGEACPFEPVTGESIDSELAALPLIIDSLRGKDPRNIENNHVLMEEAIVGHTALKAGIDIALYDILGKDAGLPVYQLLGGASNSIKTDITISIGEPEQMATEAQQYVSSGFSQLKVKAGIDPHADEQAIQAILNTVTPTTEIKVDANQGWTAKQTIAIMEKFKGTNLHAVEQPLPYWQHEQNKLIRQSITQNLMLDESVHSPSDAMTAIKNGEADLINIKLMKSKGIFGAEGINKIAESAGLNCMIGCMAETSIGICAAVHFAAAHSNVAYCDLDIFMMFKQPKWLLDKGFTQEQDRLQLSDKPGLGINVNF